MKFSFLNVAKGPASTWSATNDDPQFVFRWRWFRPRCLLFHLDGRDGSLNPVIYWDKGGGFHEGDTVPVDHVGSTVYALNLVDVPRLRALRIDPSSHPTSFVFHWFAVYRDGALAKTIRLALNSAGQPASPGPRFRWLAEAATSDAGRPHDQAVGDLPSFCRYVEGLAKDALVVPGATGSSDGAVGLSLVVPTFNTPPAYLDALLGSFLGQGRTDAELILSDDGSTEGATCRWLEEHRTSAQVRIIRWPKNCGIAETTNRGIAIARGRWLGLVDHDDALAPGALSQLFKAIAQNPRAEFFYTDEVVTDIALRPVGLHAKPAYDPVLLSGVNYINHLSVYRRHRLNALGGLRPGFEGSQDYDLLLRYLSGLPAEAVVHVPFPAYFWRRGGSTFSAKHLDQATEAARRTLAEHVAPALGKLPIDPALAGALHRPRLDAMVRQWPHVTILIPNRDSFPLIGRILSDLATRTDYPTFEILVIDNGTRDPAVLRLYDEQRLLGRPFRADIVVEPFNFARQVNRGLRLAGGDHVVLLNNDIEVLAEDWLREMVSCLWYPDTGIVGARLLYPDRTIQHAGVVIGLGGLAGHWFERASPQNPGPLGRLHVRQTLSAVTGACMLISRSCLERVGNFDEDQFKIAYNDVDYCLRAAAAGLRTVWTPFATLIHRQSASRGSDETPANRGRFQAEQSALRRVHGTERFEDPAFSPWYTRHRSVPALRLRGELPSARMNGLVG